jgi:ATP-dependent helicase IRC3
MKRFKLRPYQKSAVNSVVSRYKRRNANRVLLYLPTGAGKTVIATFIIKELIKSPGFGKVLFVAHRREILDQTVRTIKRELPDLSIQIEQGERTSTHSAAITIASVQSLVRRKERFDPTGFSLIICDECHRALAPSWEEVIDYFVSHRGGKTLLVGMTATPNRTDGRSALNVFNEIAFEISRTDLEDLGYLVPMGYYTVRSNLNLNQVKMNGGDFQVNALSKVMDMPSTRALTVQAWL